MQDTPPPPYLPPEAEKFAVRDVRYAGFWIRFGAGFIDQALLGIANTLLLGAFSPIREEDPKATALSVLLAVLYFTLQHGSSYQATLGMRFFNLKIVGPDYNRISYLRATGRYVSEILSTILLCIGYFMIAWTKRKQGLHDKIAETYVIDCRAVKSKEGHEARHIIH